MQVCPDCRAEYLEHINNCPRCQVELISKDQAQKLPDPQAEISKEALVGSDLSPLLEGNLESCREVEKILHEQRIPCALYPKDLSIEDNAATLGASQNYLYIITVREEDLATCKEVLEYKFFSDVQKEGQGSFVKDVVNTDDDEITCPGCNQKSNLIEGECSGCGLYLGD